jgi:hypothetical protein
MIWPWGQRSRSQEGHAYTNYLSMNSFVGFIWIIWPWGQRSRSHEGHYGTRRTALWSCTYELSINEQFCWIYLNYLTLRSKVKVPWRSLWYATHRLIVMHPHTNYHWHISKDKNVMARTRKYYLKNNYLTLRSKSQECHYGTWHTALWSCTHMRNIIDLSRKTKKLLSRQASLRRSGSGRKKSD